MSNTPATRRDEDGAILPDPVTEDGLVHPSEREHPEDEIDDKDGGLTDIGGGDPEKRKII